MEMLLAGDDPILEVLREQFRVADVTKRELTGVGFFVTFSVPPGVPFLEWSKLSHLGDVKAEMEGSNMVRDLCSTCAMVRLITLKVILMMSHGLLTWIDFV